MLKTSCSGNICIFLYDSPINEGLLQGGRELVDAGGESSHRFSELVYGASWRHAEREGDLQGLVWTRSSLRCQNGNTSYAKCTVLFSTWIMIFNLKHSDLYSQWSPNSVRVAIHFDVYYHGIEWTAVSF